MLTLSALVDRPELGLRFLTGRPAGTGAVETALIVTDTDLHGWATGAPDAFRRVLLILPFTGDGARFDDVLRRLGGVEAAGVVLTAVPDGRVLTAVPDGGVPRGTAARGHGTPVLVADAEPIRLWTEVTALIRGDREDGTEHFREMHREATRPDGLDRLVRWLARRVEGHVVLLDRAGVPRYAHPEVPERVMERAAADIERVVGGESRSAAVDTDAGVVHIQSIGERTWDATLVVARRECFPASVRNMIGDASRLLSLRWRAEDAGGRGRALDAAEAHAREAVLHLLFTGQTQAARRVAETLGPSLAGEIRVYILEVSRDARDRSAAECDRASRGRAWVVRCPVHTGHLIVLAPVTGAADAMDETLHRYAARSRGVDIGRSHTVPLPELASGYGQAFHALAIARGNPEHFAVFTPRGDLAALVRPGGQEWAAAELKPLHDHRPGRVQDPDAAELTATLRSWLDFSGGAARQLKIHRNTLSARLKLIERLLGRRLDDLETQSRLHLALRVLDVRGVPGAQSGLEALLDSTEVRHWAAKQLAPLTGHDPEPVLGTLRAWLRNDGRLEPTASALGISVPGARKRLIRIEGMLGRSLLSGPSARYDLWFALNVHDSGPVDGGACRPGGPSLSR